MSESNVKYTEAEALEFHSRGRPGQDRDHRHQADGDAARPGLAYSPGVAVPVRAIAENPGLRLRLYGQGQSRRGHLQRHRDPRPRQSRRARLQAGDGRQGGAVQALRRRRRDRHRGRRPRTRRRFIDAVELLEPSFGGINLEDIAAPDCFIIEQTLRERMNIPVFHDDQHGTAIITAAGLINACHLTEPQARRHQGGGERRRRRGDRLHRARSRRWACAATMSSCATARA